MQGDLPVEASLQPCFSTNLCLKKEIRTDCINSKIEIMTDAFLFYRVPIFSRSEKSIMINPE